MSADEYLIHYGVKDGINGLNFKNSSFLSDDQYRMIDLVVEYDIEVYFFKLFRRIRRSMLSKDAKYLHG